MKTYVYGVPLVEALVNFIGWLLIKSGAPFCSLSAANFYIVANILGLKNALLHGSDLTP